MYKYNIYVGMFDKDTKQQEMSSTDILNTIRKVLRQMSIDNYTIYKGKGHYKSDSMIVCKPTFIIEIIREGILLFQQINSIRFRLCNELNQESVLITRTEVEVL